MEDDSIISAVVDETVAVLVLSSASSIEEVTVVILVLASEEKEVSLASKEDFYSNEDEKAVETVFSDETIIEEVISAVKPA